MGLLAQMDMPALPQEAAAAVVAAAAAEALGETHLCSALVRGRLALAAIAKRCFHCPNLRVPGACPACACHPCALESLRESYLICAEGLRLI